MEKHFAWQGHKWRITPYWGDHHNEKKQVWYGKDAVCIDTHDQLMLDCLYKPKKFTDGVTRDYQVGFVVGETEYRYGTFSWKAKLPKGKNMWPGLWLASNQEWPPEIDCMEAWSRHDKDTYTKRLLWIDLHPTMHWTENGGHKSEAKFNTLRCWLDEKGFNTYTVEWMPYGITVWYNGRKVKTFDNPKLLEHLNREDIWMFPIMTLDLWDKNGRQFDEEKYKDYKKNGHPFVIERFIYTPAKGLAGCMSRDIKLNKSKKK